MGKNKRSYYYREKNVHEKFLDACFNGNLELVKEFLKQGADIDSITLPTKHRALGLAVISGNLEVVKFLISIGVDINQKESEFDDTPLHIAVEGSSIAYSHIEDETNEIPEIDIIKFLVENNADVNALNNRNKTPLDYSWYTEIGEILTKAGGKRSNELDNK